MKNTILIFLLLPLFGMGQSKYRAPEIMNCRHIMMGADGGSWYLDTVQIKSVHIPITTILVQFTYRDAITVRDVYLINGEPWVKQREKWVKVKAYRWKLSNGWSK